MKVAQIQLELFEQSATLRILSPAFRCEAWCFLHLNYSNPIVCWLAVNFKVSDAEVVRVDGVVLSLNNSEGAEALRVLDFGVVSDCKTLNANHLLENFTLVQNNPLL